MSTVSTDRIQGLSGSIAVKIPCRVATTAVITLSGLQTIDAVALVAGDRVLVKNQTDTTQNGLYEANTSAWQRTLDCDGLNDICNGTLVPVANGTAASHSVFMALGTDPLIPGTSEITFSLIA